MPTEDENTERAKQQFFAGLAAYDDHDYATAETRFKAALAIVPGRVSALVNLALALFHQEKLGEAVEVAKLALSSDPKDVEALAALGSAQVKLGDLDAAAATMERAVAAAPADPLALTGRASVRLKLKQFDLAIADYEVVRRVEPNRESLNGLMVSAKLYACDWRDLDGEISRLLAGVRAGTEVCDPFLLQAVPGATAADQLAAARQAITLQHRPTEPLYRGEAYRHDRIRLAYVSGDFHKHPTAYLIDHAIELHDRSRFETFAFSYGPDDGSEQRRRSVNAFEHFLDVRDQSNDAVAAAMRAQEIDVAVDLGGFTTGGRLSIFARRPAPVQATYLGYPGTTGAPYIDYLIADPVVIPLPDHGYYSEKIVTLPDCYQANDNTQSIDARPPRAACGLPERAFVFASFNNSYKINAGMFAIWMRLLARVPGSVLWLMRSNEAMTANLRREAAAQGVEPERLIFAPTIRREQHLARCRVADLLLDTLPYNAHTTAADALWAGLPVVTCPGATFPSRVAASLLGAMGLQDLVTRTLADYEALALALATDPVRLASLKARVAANRATTALFDTARQTRDLEAAYTTMVARHRAGEAPAAFLVERTVG